MKRFVKLAILGGSFNPIHKGHLFLADTALSSLNYDRVVMVPALRSPFKLSASEMENSAAQRLEMLAASIAGNPRLTFDDCEIRRGGVSYTVDTLRDIITRYMPDEKPGLIIGDDLAAEFLQWHKSREILHMADIIIARRVHTQRIEYPYPNIQIANERLEISSALIRERIQTGAAWRDLVPPAACAIIEEQRLYGCKKNAGNSESSAAPASDLVLRVEEAVRKSLDAGRFLHSRNTAILAWDLCQRFGLDPALGYLAGVAHDLAKQMDGETLLRLAEKDGKPITKLQQKKSGLLHGRACAVLLREQFGIHNEDVLEAVALHTSGSDNMGPLAKVIYIADKLEVSREKAEPVLRKMCYTEDVLDRIFYATFDQNVSWLRSRKLELSEDTYRLLERMKGKNP
ncbi:MAG: nicotinate (nicotinamide) nucleotide adenylyltransferase [Treponema sp.]|nr:nicotinate (nicotinamide) nucleotide adenylyltransferase [Treponema sp.]